MKYILGVRKLHPTSSMPYSSGLFTRNLKGKSLQDAEDQVQGWQGTGKYRQSFKSYAFQMGIPTNSLYTPLRTHGTNKTCYWVSPNGHPLPQTLNPELQTTKSSASSLLDVKESTVFEKPWVLPQASNSLQQGRY